MVQISAKKNSQNKNIFGFRKILTFIENFFRDEVTKKKIVTSPRKKNFRKKNFFFDFCDYQVFFSKSRIFQNFSNFTKMVY